MKENLSPNDATIKNGSFNDDSVEYFIEISKTQDRDYTVAEMAVFIYADTDWEDNWDRRDLLDELINLVF
jgi:hypothetical protein